MSNKIFGYARISTMKDTQTHERQIKALKDYAKENGFTFDEIVSERISGTVKTESRPAYTKLKDKLRAGDILVLTDIDRLGRNADNTIMELKDLKSKGIKVIALDTPFMCEFDKVNNDSMYEMIIDILITLKSHLAQQENEKRIKAINQGLDVAREKGVTLGRPPAKLDKDFSREYKKFLNGEYGNMTVTKFSKMLGIGRSTFYKYKKQYEEEN